MRSHELLRLALVGNGVLAKKPRGIDEESARLRVADAVEGTAPGGRYLCADMVLV